MSKIDMRIQKRDLPVIILSAAGGFIFTFSLGVWYGIAKGALVSLALGVPGGMLGGVIVCILRRYYERDGKVKLKPLNRARLVRLVIGAVVFGSLMGMGSEFESRWTRVLVAVIAGVVIGACIAPVRTTAARLVRLVIGAVVFGVLMGIRPELGSHWARLLVAAIAGAALGVCIAPTRERKE